MDTTLIVALGGGAGLALLLRELVAVFAALRQGVSAREGKRRIDIVQQRDEALVRASRAENRFNLQGVELRAVKDYTSRLRRQLIEGGVEPIDAPPEYDTITTYPA